MNRALATFLLLMPFAVQAQTPSPAQMADELKSLRQEQEALKKELQALKQQLENHLRPPTPALPAALDISSAPVKGNMGASVALIEYSDYQCPFCGRFVANTYVDIAREYVDSGKVRHYFRDLPLANHENAFKAAEASHCAAEQGKFWAMHDRLFANQKALAAAELPKHAEAIGADVAKFQQCLDSGRYAERIRRDIAEANGAGLSGTPSFLVGYFNPDGKTVKIISRVVGAKPYDEFKRAIDAAIAARPQ